MIRYHLNDTVLIHMRAIRIAHQFQFHPHSVHIKKLAWMGQVEKLGWGCKPASYPPVENPPCPHKNRTYHISDTFYFGGRGWIRTIEAYATDLQSAPFGHSGTRPYGADNRTWTCMSVNSLEPESSASANSAISAFGADDGTWTHTRNLTTTSK